MVTNLKLRGAISEAGLTIGKLAEMIKLKKSALSRRINGHIDFKEKEILKICNLLKKEPTEIFFNINLTDEQKIERMESEVS